MCIDGMVAQSEPLTDEEIKRAYNQSLMSAINIHPVIPLKVKVAQIRREKPLKFNSKGFRKRRRYKEAV